MVQMDIFFIIFQTNERGEEIIMGYKLDKLIKIEDNLGKNEKEEIFFKMFDFLENNYIRINSTEELSNIMNDGNYFVAHKIVRYKGKKRFYNGAMAISTKQRIIEFIERDILDNDLRSLLITPIFNMIPKYMIYLQEDGVILLFSPKSKT